MTTFNSEQKKTLDQYWQAIKIVRDQYFDVIDKMEKNLQKDLNISDLEIFFSSGEPVGFGNYSRTYQLYQPEE